MLISEYFERVYEEIDKEGMPYFEEKDLLNRFKTAAYFFIEQNVEFLQNTQKAKEDFSMLTIPFEISEKTDEIFKLDRSFYRLQSLSAVYEDKKIGLPIAQANDIDALKEDPFHSPTKDEPLCIFYQNGFEVSPEPLKVKGLFIKHPTFGIEENDELINEFSINIQLFIIEKVVLHLMTTIGDSRYQMQFYQSKSNTES